MAEDEKTGRETGMAGEEISDAGVGMSGSEGAGENLPGTATPRFDETPGGEGGGESGAGGGEGGERAGDWNPGEYAGGGGEVY